VGDQRDEKLEKGVILMSKIIRTNLDIFKEITKSDFTFQVTEWEVIHGADPISVPDHDEPHADIRIAANRGSKIGAEYDFDQRYNPSL
jgi:hypothetical protein